MQSVVKRDKVINFVLLASAFTSFFLAMIAARIYNADATVWMWGVGIGISFLVWHARRNGNFLFDKPKHL